LSTIPKDLITTGNLYLASLNYRVASIKKASLIFLYSAALILC